MASNDLDDEDDRDQTGHYEQRHPRINKPDMFIFTALWMEMSPLAECPDNFGRKSQLHPHTEQEDRDDHEFQPENITCGGKLVQKETRRENDSSFQEKVHKAGAVYVLPNDRALSVDCSRKGVHAAVIALNNFGQERAKGCQVYLSRRPCSFCAKLLVQCEVAKVFYLPLEPEWNDPEDIRRVDNIFKASSTGLSNFIPRIRPNVITELRNRSSPFAKKGRSEETIQQNLATLVREYFNDKWIEFAGGVLKWPAFTDNMKRQTLEDMQNLLEWIARATSGDVPDDNVFAEIDPTTMKAKKENAPSSSEYDEAMDEQHPQPISTNSISSEVRCQTQAQQGQVATPRSSGENGSPNPGDGEWQKLALHMSRLAQMLSQRSDDPTRRVGCVLMLRYEVVAIGWNGFPAKSLYGEFPRGSSTDRTKEKKEPYVIHAEQNALLTRNKRNMNHGSSILFCNNIPAPECVPMLIQARVKNVLVPFEPLDSPDNKAFLEALKRSKLVGFWPKEVTNPARRNLAFSLEESENKDENSAGER